MLNPGVPVRRGRGLLKWALLAVFIFMVLTLLVFARLWTWREVIYVNITHKANISSIPWAVTTTTAANYNPVLDSLMSSSSSSSSVSSIASRAFRPRTQPTRVRETAPLIETTTTQPSYDYMSYRMRVPVSLKKCNPLERPGFNGTIIPADRCVVVNSSCCPCAIREYVGGAYRTTSYGGRVDAIAERNAAIYMRDYLHNCSGFPVVCKMASSPSGCNYAAACVGGTCQLAARF